MTIDGRSYRLGCGTFVHSSGSCFVGLGRQLFRGGMLAGGFFEWRLFCAFALKTGVAAASLTI
jgi:hypothetical protein